MKLRKLRSASGGPSGCVQFKLWLLRRSFTIGVGSLVIAGLIFIRWLTEVNQRPKSYPEHALGQLVLSRGGTLRIHGRSKEFKKGSRLPYSRFKIESIELSAANLNDSDVQLLAANEEIQSLDLSQNALTDDTASVFRELKGLKFLNLTRTYMTEVGVSEVQKRLPQCKITYSANASLSQWALRTGAATLIEVEVELSSRGTRGRRRCKKPSELPSQPILHIVEADFSNSPILDDRSMVHFLGVDGVQTLILDDTKISDRSVDLLVGLHDLRHLSICNTRLSEDGIQRLRTALPETKIEVN